LGQRYSPQIGLFDEVTLLAEGMSTVGAKRAVGVDPFYAALQEIQPVITVVAHSGDEVLELYEV
jgi:hypothetical protein